MGLRRRKRPQHTYLQPEIDQMHGLNIGEEAIIYDVPDLRLLASLGIRIGKPIKVITKSFAKGPLVLSVQDRHVVIDRKLAEQIIIKR